MDNKSLFVYDSPLGQILIIENGIAITHLYFANRAATAITQINGAASTVAHETAWNTNRAIDTGSYEAACSTNKSAATDSQDVVWCTNKAAKTGSHEAMWRETALLKEAGRQLQEYFSGQRKKFSLPLAPAGTVFQHSVWNALKDIPYGETRSYGQIARTLGKAKAARAVGRANNKNPISIIIPCHRVIGADGKLVGYGGGLDKKAYLLALEKENAGARK